MAEQAQLNSLVGSGRTKQAFGEVLGATSIAVAAYPLVASAAGGIALLPGGGYALAGGGVYGTVAVAAEGVSIASAYSSGSIDGIETFRRSGLLAGPIIAGGGAGVFHQSALARSLNTFSYHAAAPLVRYAPALVRRYYTARVFAHALDGPVVGATGAAVAQPIVRHVLPAHSGTATSRVVPNPGGRLGNAATRAKSQATIADLVSRGFTDIQTEVRFRAGSLGSSKNRFADIVGRNPVTKETEIIQIGRTLKSDPRVPVIRERLALDDIIFSPAFRISLIPRSASLT